MDRGLLVPDSIIIGLISERLKRSDASGGFSLMGSRELSLRLKNYPV